MKIERIGRRGVFFTFGEGDAPFEYNTSVYLINTGKRIFLCDTHTGPKSMDIVKNYINDNGWNNKELIIFNSHSDWDHIWGNCAFEYATIIGHVKAKERMLERGRYDLERLGRFHNGEIELKLPDRTFESLLCFEEDKIDFVYAPGHTIDSSICIDKKDSVVFAGDLIEHPLPTISHYDLQGFLNSLEAIKSNSAETILSAHSGKVSEELLKENIDYVRDLLELGGLMPVEEKDEEWQSLHYYNVKNLMFLKHVDFIKEMQGNAFDYKRFKQEFWSSVNPEYNNMDIESSYFQSTGYDKLEAAIISYAAMLNAINKSEIESKTKISRA